METAGRAVVFSGTTVAIGLLALVALPLPFLRCDRLRRHADPARQRRWWRSRCCRSCWRRPARASTGRTGAPTTRPAAPGPAGPRPSSRRRWLAAGARRWRSCSRSWSPPPTCSSARPNADTIAKRGDAKDGLVALERSGIGAGALLPHEVLVEGGTSPTGRRRAAQGRRDPRRGRARRPQLAPRRHGDRRGVPASPTAATTRGRATRSTACATTAHAAGPDVRVGGQPAPNQDFIDAVYGNFPLMIALIAIITFILLARAFRSLLLPLKAVVLNVLSVAAAWGVLVLVWQHGYGSEAIWGIEATGSIPSWMPLMVFAFLFGLSMDYEVFILVAHARGVRPHRLDRRPRSCAGIGRTGRLVTSAALILFLAFVAMASGPETDVKMLATGLGGRDPARRDGDPRAARARGGVADRPLELVAAGVAGAAAARRAVAAAARGKRGGG